MPHDNRPRTTQDRGADALCANCGDVLAEIHMTVDGEELTMRSCAACGVRSWHRAGIPFPLEDVLADLSARDTRYQRLTAG